MMGFASGMIQRPPEFQRPQPFSAHPWLEEGSDSGPWQSCSGLVLPELAFLNAWGIPSVEGTSLNALCFHSFSTTLSSASRTSLSTWA